MKDFEAIKVLWKVQKEVPVSYDTVIKNISANRKSYAVKLVLQGIVVFIAIIAVVAIWFLKHFYTWTTHLSMFILCYCMIYYLIMQFREYKQVKQFDQHLLKPHAFIEYLKRYKQNSYLFNTRNFKMYTLGIGTAFLLILFELYFITSPLLFLIFTIAAVAWFLYSYFVLMKAYTKQEKSRIEDDPAELCGSAC